MGSLKDKAKNALKGNWKVIISSYLTMGILPFIVVYVLGLFVLSATSELVVQIILNLILIPLTFGLNLIFLNLYSEEGPEYNQLFEFYGSKFLNCIGTGFLKSLFIFLWSIPVYLWVSYLVVFVIPTETTGSIISPIYNVENIDVIKWFLIGLILYIPGIIKMLSYSMTELIYVDNDFDHELLNCITASRKMMDGQKFKLFKLVLLFLVYYFLICFGFAVLGGLIGTSSVNPVIIIFLLLIVFISTLVWLYAYFQATVTAFYLKVKEDYLNVKEDYLVEEVNEI